MNTITAIVYELGHLPAGYMQAVGSLRASVRLAAPAGPADAEIDATLDRLEADRLVSCQADPFAGKRYCLTAAGRAKYTELFSI